MSRYSDCVRPLDIAARYALLSKDEQAVIAFVLDGLEAGRAVYGALDVKRDPRSFMREAAAELRDLLCYVGAEQARGDAP